MHHWRNLQARKNRSQDGVQDGISSRPCVLKFLGCGPSACPFNTDRAIPVLGNSAFNRGYREDPKNQENKQLERNQEHIRKFRDHLDGLQSSMLVA